MAPHRAEILSQQLQQKAAEYLQRESNRTSLITVTRCVLSENQKHATIFFTVLPTDKEAVAIEFVRRQRGDFIQFIRDTAKIGRLPLLDFKLDVGEKNRQRIDELSNGAV